MKSRQTICLDYVAVSSIFKYIIYIFIIISASVHSLEFKKEKNSKFLRWYLKVNKDQLIVTKTENWVLIETFEEKIFEELKLTLERNELENDYFRSVKFTKEYFPERPAQVQLFLKNNTIELFKFFKPEDQQLVLDFWVNPEIKVTETEKIEVPESKPVVEQRIVEEKKPDLKNDFKPLATVDRVVSWTSSNEDVEKNSYKDFRYGGTILWPYKGMEPQHQPDIILGSKVPEFFFPLKTPNVSKDDRESTLQLMINFYKKEKFGLMKKTIDLFNQKFKANDKEKVFLSYLEANTLLKSAIANPSSTIMQGGMARLENIIKQSDEYGYQKVSYRFLIQYAINRGDYKKSLELSKNFFIRSNENRDKEMIYLSTKTILYSLAQLNQVEKLDQFINEPQVAQWLDTQEGVSYKIYSQFKRREYQKVLSSFERIEKTLERPLDSSICFHVAESYFQVGELEKALSYYKDFITHHAFLSYSSYARTRKALISELIEEPISKVLGNYLEAIDKATLPDARVEAKIRYVAAAYNRKQVVTDGDKLILAFLDIKDDEKSWLVGDNQLLLWQTRLRSFIREGNYSDALTYFTTIPTDKMAMIHKRLFEADGTEIVLGLMQKSYQEGDNGRVIKLWGIYQDKMGGNLKENKQALFYAGNASMRLGLKTNSEQILANYRTARDHYPQWVKRDYTSYEDDAVIAKQIVLNKKWDKLDEHLSQYKNKDGVYAWAKVHLFMSKNEFRQAQVIIEELLVNKNLLKAIEPSELSDILDLYLTCLDKTENAERLQQRIAAVIDVMGNKKDLFKEVRERARFLLSESLVREKNRKAEEVIEYLDGFILEFPKSSYAPRIVYNKALYLFSQDRKEEGTKVLNELIKNNTTPEYIREMAKSELHSLAIP